MRRGTLNYFRDERARLAERLTDVQAETATLNARRVELEREESLLADLLQALDAHVPAEAVVAVPDFPRRIGAGAA